MIITADYTLHCLEINMDSDEVDVLLRMLHGQSIPIEKQAAIDELKAKLVSWVHDEKSVEGYV